MRFSIAKAAGYPIDIDRATKRVSMAKAARVCVEVLAKPLPEKESMGSNTSSGGSKFFMRNYSAVTVCYWAFLVRVQ